MTGLETIRQRIDHIDQDMIVLLAKRQRLVEEAGRFILNENQKAN